MSIPFGATHKTNNGYFFKMSSDKFTYYFTPSHVWRLWLSELPNDLEELV